MSLSGNRWEQIVASMEREVRGYRTILAALVARQAKDGPARVVVTEEELSRLDLSKLRVVTEPLGGSVLLRYGDVEA